MGRIRIAIARVAQETNTFSPVLTREADFRRTHWKERGELLAACERGGTEVEGFTRNAELSGFVRAVRKSGADVELVPLFSAWAIPGGPLAKETHEGFVDRLHEEVKGAGSLDAVYLSLHGAMGAQGTDDPEADLADAVRAANPGAKIAVTLDMHAQLHQRFVDQVDLLVGYRTNPHRDHARCGFRAGRHLVRELTENLTPTSAWRTLPLVCGGGTTLDFLPPMRGIHRWMAQQERRGRAVDVNLFHAHLWNDSPELGWSTHVTTHDDPAAAEALAEELADKLWAVRDVPMPHFPTASESIAMARSARLARRLGTVCICDASDIVGAGAAGENTALVRALLDEAQDLLSYAAVRDGHAVAELWEQPDGHEVVTTVGGRLHPELNEALQVQGRIVRKVDTRAFGRVVLLDLGCVQLVVTEEAPLVMKPSFFSDVGLRAMKADIVVVKSMFPFRLYFAAQNRKTIYARTRGVTDFDFMHQLEFVDPVYPVDDVQDWRPTDRRRRGQ